MNLVATLAREAGISVRDVERIVATAPKRYKVYTIPKRNGDDRIIAQPAVEVKALQHLLIMRVFSSLPVHESAYAYVRGRSIRQNAQRHVKSDRILKLDFKSFFNSIRPVDLERVLHAAKNLSVSATDFDTIYQIAFWGGRTAVPIGLSVGAPSSPMLSNIVMYDFDKQAGEIAAELGITYTRYADDITASSSKGQGSLLRFERSLVSLLKRSRLNLHFNDEKRGLYGRGERRMVTGLIITPDGAVSIGRERKRSIRAMTHKVVLEKATDFQIMRCKGMLAFALSAEPTFVRSLARVYGRDAIRSILRTPNISFHREDDILE
jgi:RNA-directed DNA polymerase